MLKKINFSILLFILISTLSFGQGMTPTGQNKGTLETLGGAKIDSMLWLPVRSLATWPYANNFMPYIGGIQINPVDTLPYYMKRKGVYYRFLTTADSFSVAIDSFEWSTRAWRQKGVDSVMSASLVALADTASSIRSSIPVISGFATHVDVGDTANNIRSYLLAAVADTSTVLRGLIPSLSGYATTAAVNDTAINVRNYGSVNLADTATVLRGLIPSLSGYATTAALNDTAINVRTYGTTNLADTSTVLRGLIPSLTGYATTAALNDTAINVRSYGITNLADTSTVLRGLIPSLTGYATTVALNDTAINVRSYGATNLADTAVVLRGLIPSLNGYATTVALNDTAINVRLYGATNLADTAALRVRYADSLTVYATPKNLKDTASQLRTTINTKLSSVNIAGGANTNVTGSSPSYTVSATPTSGTSSIQYNKSGVFASAANTKIDSADGNLMLITQSYSVGVTNPNPGTLKVLSDSMYGFPLLKIVSAATGLQTSLQTMTGHHFVGNFTTNGTTYVLGGFYTSALVNSGTTTYNLRTYDATNNAPNMSYVKQTTSASNNSSSGWYFGYQQRDAMIGNNNFGAGSLLTIVFCLPAYASTQRIFVGYAAYFGSLSTTINPSEILNTVGVAKDTADATLQIIFNNGSGTATKVNTGITPTVNDVYRVTVWIPSNTAIEYVTLERFTKSTATIFGAGNTSKIPSAGTYMYMHSEVNTGQGVSAVSMGIHSIEDSQDEW